jgi:hypothetical protein
LRLETPYFEALFHQIRRNDPSLPERNSWSEIVPPFDGSTRADDHAGQYLRAAWQAYHGDGNPGWLTVLLSLFWSRLLLVWRRHLSKSEDPDLLWITIQESFIDAIHETRASGLGCSPWALLWFATETRLRSCLRPLWVEQCRARSSALQIRPAKGKKAAAREVQDLADPRSRDRFHEVEEDLDRQKRERALRYCAQRGWISEAEYPLLVGLMIYGVSLRAYAESQDLDYELLKKRSQRARRKLERRRNMSPEAHLAAFSE